ncbi:transposase [Mycoplasma sp. P36-A1]|uniref:transposase n=1 Tax=Mycoplasma sp. P36-A1 TaxID=3252900 RepID=UPI003C2C8A47
MIYEYRIYSLRKIEQACKTDIRFMSLCNIKTPSHNAFATFINENLVDKNIENIFYDINKYIISCDDSIDTSKLYIDGTKFESNAKKTSFVWHKAVEKFQQKLFTNVSTFIVEYNKCYDQYFPVKNKYKSTYLKTIIEDIEINIKKQKIEFVYGKGSRKGDLQRKHENINDYYSRLAKYEKHFKIFENRNSYSKNDHDATFMHMKYDYYNNTGVFSTRVWYPSRSFKWIYNGCRYISVCQWFENIHSINGFV